VRTSDLTRWSDVQGYRNLVGGDAAALSEKIAELEQATPELDRLAEQLLERWLSIVAGVAGWHERRLLAS
jgi:hypothetical protein